MKSIESLERKLCRPTFCVLAASLAAAVSGISCQKAAAPPQAPEVKAMAVIQRTTPIHAEFVGQVAAYLEVELRSKVSGILKRRAFQPGAVVQMNEVLFEIDPRPYAAALDDAKALLAQSQAGLIKAQQDVDRYRPLQAENAIPKETLDNAIATLEQAKAEVEARQASVRQAELNLDDSLIRSPVNGQVGLQMIEEGGLATAGQTVLAKVSQNDPAYVYFAISETDYLDIVERWKREGTKALDEAASRARTHLFLVDGSPFPYEGKIDFADRAISEDTGTLMFRAQFSNPDLVLRPGMFARVRVTYTTLPDALLVPQEAVSQVLGKYFVTVVAEGDVAEMRPVRVGPRIDNLWVVLEGLKPGERVVVEGQLKAQPGTRLKITTVTESDLAGT
ncbi:MAG: efflux RND transporter periplasmic adaptor subunit [Acidobacteriota bacterium]